MKVDDMSPVKHGVFVQERRLPMELDEKVAKHLPALRVKLNVTHPGTGRLYRSQG